MDMCGPKAAGDEEVNLLSELGRAQHLVLLFPDSCHHLSAHVLLVMYQVLPHVLLIISAVGMKSLQAAERLGMCLLQLLEVY
jgi:hypothetical protein